MRILFVNPYIYDFTAYDLWLRPLGLLYLAAVVRRYTDCEIFWLDALDRFQDGGNAGDESPVQPGRTKSKPDGRGKFIRKIVEKPDIYRSVPRHYARYGIPEEDFQRKLENLPDVDHIFLTSLMTYWHDGIRFTLKLVMDRFPQASISLGGILPTLMPGYVKNNLPVDHRFHGRGEDQILRFLNGQGAKVKSLPNFSSLKDIPEPANDLLSTQRFLPLLTARGCPYKCTYCASRLLNKKFSQRPVVDVISEIHHAVDTFATDHFIIFDDALLINKREHFSKIFSSLADGPALTFHTPNGLHAKEIDRETSSILYQSGFKTIRLGFESTDPDILKKSDHKLDISNMAAALDHLERAGFQRRDIEVYLLFGLPGQNVDNLTASLAHVRDLGAIPRLSVFSPVPGTPDFVDLQKEGRLLPEPDPYETNKIYFLYRKSGMTIQDITGIKDLTREIAQTNGPAREAP